MSSEISLDITELESDLTYGRSDVGNLFNKRQKGLITMCEAQKKCNKIKELFRQGLIPYIATVEHT